MITASFEVATLVDAIGRAASYAPKSEPELSKAGGIQLKLFPHQERAQLQATNLTVSYEQWIPLAECKTDEDDPTWRLPADTAEKIIGRLPMTMGALATLTDEPDDGYLHIRSGSSKARMRLIHVDLPFPQWKKVHLDDLSLVAGLGDRIGQVRWATHSKITGVWECLHFTGTHLQATDKNVAARVPLECALEPVTAPMQFFLPAMQGYPEVYIGTADGRFVMALDDDTQLQTFTITEPFPPVDNLIDSPVPHVAIFEREPMLKVLRRVAAIAEAKNMPQCRLDLRDEAIQVSIDVPDVGSVEDEITTTAPVEPVSFSVSSDKFQAMVTACRGSFAQLTYGDIKQPYKVADAFGFVGVAMPRRTT